MSETKIESGPVLPEARMNVVSPKEPVIGRVIENELCMRGKSASFVRHTQIDVSGTPLAGAFRAGQAFGVIPPGEDEQGRPHKVRLYSIASPTCGEDGAGQVLATTCKRTIDEYQAQRAGDDETAHHLFLGVCSNYLCDLRPGDEVRVTGPNGKRFLLPVEPEHHDYVFIATGTGIAPFRGMAMELLGGPDGPVDSQVHLLMGVPYTTDLLYDDLFTDYADRFESFTYTTAISREPRGGRDRGIYVDRALEEQLDRLAPVLRSPRTLIYMCGLAGMQYGVFRVLARHGLAEPYLTVRGDLEGVDPAEWDDARMKRGVRPTERCMLEVY